MSDYLQAYVLETQNYRRNKGAVIGAYQSNNTTGNFYSGQVSGKITNIYGEALIGAIVLVVGTTNLATHLMLPIIFLNHPSTTLGARTNRTPSVAEGYMHEAVRQL